MIALPIRAQSHCDCDYFGCGCFDFERLHNRFFRGFCRSINPGYDRAGAPRAVGVRTNPAIIVIVRSIELASEAKCFDPRARRARSDQRAKSPDISRRMQPCSL
jgi:hypothetical protein